MKYSIENLDWDTIDDDVIDYYTERAHAERAKAFGAFFSAVKTRVHCLFDRIVHPTAAHRPCHS